jgi:hypothetical protein
MLKRHEFDSLEALGRHLQESASGEHEGIVVKKALQGVKPGKDPPRQRNERLREVAFFFHLATGMNFAVHERLEPLGPRLVACIHGLQRNVLRAVRAEDFDASAFARYSVGLEPEVLQTGAEVQGTASAAGRSSRDYFGGEGMLFPAEQPELHSLKTRQ